MKKIRNDKMDGRFYSDEYVGDLNKRIYDLREENKLLQERIEKAIEYIENHSRFMPPDYSVREFNNAIGINETLSILQDKEQ